MILWIALEKKNLFISPQKYTIMIHMQNIWIALVRHNFMLLKILGLLIVYVIDNPIFAIHAEETLIFILHNIYYYLMCWQKCWKTIVIITVKCCLGRVKYIWDTYENI